MMTGYIDPTVTPATRRQAMVLAAVRARGLNLHRVHRDGQTLRLTGPNIFVLVSDLESLSLADLDPPSQNELNFRTRLLAKG